MGRKEVPKIFLLFLYKQEWNEGCVLWRAPERVRIIKKKKDSIRNIFGGGPQREYKSRFDKN